MVSVFGAIGPGKEFINDFLEREKINAAVESLNKVAETMY